MIYPDDPKFKVGTYRIAIEAFRGDNEHKIGAKIQIKPAKPVTTLSGGQTATVNIVDSAFFKYHIQDSNDLERLFLLLNVSNRKRV